MRIGFSTDSLCFRFLISSLLLLPCVIVPLLLLLLVVLFVEVILVGQKIISLKDLFKFFRVLDFAGIGMILFYKFDIHILDFLGAGFGINTQYFHVPADLAERVNYISGEFKHLLYETSFHLECPLTNHVGHFRSQPRAQCHCQCMRDTQFRYVLIPLRCKMDVLANFTTSIHFNSLALQFGQLELDWRTGVCSGYFKLQLESIAHKIMHIRTGTVPFGTLFVRRYFKPVIIFGFIKLNKFNQGLVLLLESFDPLVVLGTCVHSQKRYFISGLFNIAFHNVDIILMQLFLLSILINIVASVNTYTNCYANCNTCASDFTVCANSTTPCIPGFQFDNKTNACNSLPAYNVYDWEFNQTNTLPTPQSWQYLNQSKVTNSLVCNTLTNNQTIPILGVFQNDVISKTLLIAQNQILLMNIYFIQLNWKSNDSVQVTIQSGNNTFYSESITSNSFNSDPLKNTNLLSSCDIYLNTSINAKQFNINVTNATSGGNITFLFTPSLSLSSKWAISNFRVQTGCNNFMLYVNNLCQNCLNGFYYNTTYNDCLRCHPVCATCNGPNSTNCRSCPLYANLTGSTCVYVGYFTPIKIIFNSTTPFASACQNTYMLGGPKYGKVGVPLSLNYTLPTHRYLKIDFALVTIGDWSNGLNFSVLFENRTVFNKTSFTDPTISPYCLNEVGPIMAAITIINTDYVNHTKSTANITFLVQGVNTSAVYFGIKNLVITEYSCAPQCSACNLSSYSCSSCNQFLTLKSSCLLCPYGFYQLYSEIITCKKCHILCKSCVGPYSTNCTSCFGGFQLVGTYCATNQTQQYSFYSEELSQFGFDPSNFVSNNSNTFSCSSYLLYGNVSAPVTINRTYTLPPNKGLMVLMSVIKLGSWNTNNSNITLFINNVLVLNIYVDPTVGTQICSKTGKDFIYSLTKTQEGATSTNFQISVNGLGGGLGISEVVVILKQCDYCKNNQLSYFLEYMPVYTRDNSTRAMKTWVRFNKPIFNPQGIAIYFNLTLNNITQDIISSEYNWDLLLVYNISDPFLAYTQVVGAMIPEAIASTPDSSGLRRLSGIKQLLSTLVSSVQISRYDFIDEDDSDTIVQLYQILLVFTNAIFYATIVSLFLGLGLLFEQYLVLLQIIFAHIYISSNHLPLNLKLSLEGMQTIQHLNYFVGANRNSIESAILPTGLHQQSPHTFEQYNTDVNFIRAIYPIIILNIIYAVYFLILHLLYTYSKQFQRSEERVVRFFKEIAERPVNYLDSILKIQFFTVMWSCIQQFYQFNANSANQTFNVINSLLCILFFAGACVYMLAMPLYLWRTRIVSIKQSFNYRFEDIFFKRLKKNQNSQQSFVYLFVKLLRYLAYVVFIVEFLDHQIITSIILILVTIFQMVYILAKQIYQDTYYLTFKVIESILLILLEIMFIIIYAVSDSANYQSYMSIGYVTLAFIVILLINALIRMIYLGYWKHKQFNQRKYRYDRSKTVGETTRELRQSKPPKKAVTYLPNQSVNPSTNSRPQVIPNTQTDIY